MKNRLRVGILLFSCATVLFYGVLTGRQFLAMVSGPEALQGQDLTQRKGQDELYILCYFNELLPFNEKERRRCQNRL